MKKSELYKSMDFIFSKTAERIRNRAKALGKNAYQALGFESEIDKQLQGYKKLDIDVIRKVMKFEEGKKLNIKKMRFLIPDRYFVLLTNGLNFQDVHEMLWVGRNSRKDS
mgnify:CR=1 FL=1